MPMILAFIRYPQIDPVMFRVGPIIIFGLRVGPLAVRWYGFAYLSGFALAYAWLRKMIRDQRLLCTDNTLTDLFTWLIAGVFLGGRLGWWLFYHRAPTDVVEPWYEPVAIWHGGMSFHGGLIGVFLTLLIFSRINNLRFWNVADCLAVV